MRTNSDVSDMSDAVDAVRAILAPVCLNAGVEAALSAVVDRARITNDRAFEEGQNSMMHAVRSARREVDVLSQWQAEVRAAWEKFLRAPTDAESDEGSRALDRLMIERKP